MSSSHFPHMGVNMEMDTDCWNIRSRLFLFLRAFLLVPDRPVHLQMYLHSTGVQLSALPLLSLTEFSIELLHHFEHPRQAQILKPWGRNAGVDGR